MPTKKPRTTVTFDQEDYEELEQWAESEFRSVPQLILVIVKKALIERRASKQKEKNE
ncbi:ribbon-helix-helix domain-containing protein [Fischerella muscicola]|uniref:CopG-like ribbon-helix-helix domain-containing protein n=1 Tax=Fischerella muscicola CCMEE 5323 TaxID=2019572 RepID=A0A2N6K0E8_FISMU|nr:hypothetical protein [Fischerella muscicola]PLZ87476.1 hypothetical protein CEN44_17385 [Fischerella muscicola CCMEE 5323]PMB50514.1 hypothetical protein CEN40_01880 [Fischerella thermalis CCMEE 5205]